MLLRSLLPLPHINLRSWHFRPSKNFTEREVDLSSRRNRGVFPLVQTQNLMFKPIPLFIDSYWAGCLEIANISIISAYIS